MAIIRPKNQSGFIPKIYATKKLEDLVARPKLSSEEKQELIEEIEYIVRTPCEKLRKEKEKN